MFLLQINGCNVAGWFGSRIFFININRAVEKVGGLIVHSLGNCCAVCNDFDVVYTVLITMLTAVIINGKSDPNPVKSENIMGP